MKLSTETLKQILVGSRYVDEQEFDNAWRSSKELGKKIEDILIFRGLIKQDALSKLVSQHLKVPYIDIGRITIAPEILSLIPEKLARKYRVVPLALEGRSVKVAMEDPSDFEALEFIKRHTGLSVIPHYANEEEIVNALGQYKRNIRAEFDRVIAENIKMASPESDLQKAAEGLPIIKVVDTILEYAAAERASDVHIETQSNDVIVRFRVDGELKDIISLPRGIEEALVARVKILSNLKIDERRVPQDGRYKFNIDENVIALRISIIPGFYGENMVMRLLRESSRPLSLEELGLMGKNLEIVQANIRRPTGMILITGPTGSGKTSSLYSILNILNTIKVKICTIEDPIEYGINRVSQFQVNSKVGLTFATGLRALLRHDPDIMMVGEIRDKETAQIAVHSALTGHLVLSTLHTNDAAGAVPRLLDMGVEGFLLASTLNAVIAQRLVKKICSACLLEYQPNKEDLARLSHNLGVSIETQKFYKGKGCGECHGTGYSGRIGLYEVLPITEKIRSMITSNVAGDQIKEEAIKGGMIVMSQDGINKISSGLTTIDQVLKAVSQY
ncbi:MAG: Type IV-A pilus assembly ATPase PilB [Candidatus Woesebacteria bacterium GW2011_GWB1_43_14]|uniref:Type IV-A pilus assembly ATPase PilB n=1 Tax=Candidatus Woesebacteria bacterium GW2011_GWB1_43_14 TaxID=1618578 RepID=A0A0G1FQI4_9BACT|nr:MAG: Type IV-A pilus assembly ATPase PilB [Candidatus Woesebacteria bacterium GW2011_GWA1_39_11b]KKS77525.1 MAG: Tfp pilus assembly protein PilB, type IV pilus assembly protein PilB [Candidatus Woesebacteria bacterium GW2011_GWC1_42_9]KKS97296.1 MAG: Type IV-A pilus assembly ATPase PilB [Candidatus Woesebacteria bacterium GW2011_GWB1_43_14]